MQLVIERSILLKALARLQSIVEKRNTIPILANIKLEASAGQLQLTVTDMDLVASEAVDVEVTEEGALTVPAHTLYDIVRKLPDGAQIALNDNAQSAQLEVKAGSARFALSFLPSEDFPVMSQGDMTHHFTLPSEQLVRLLDKSRFAMSTEETRYYLNGVYLHADEQGEEAQLVAVATDGHRLARISAVLPEGASGMPGIIIPRKAVNELRKILDEQGEEVTVSLSEAKIKFAAGRVMLLSKLVDGTFPDYQRVIPSQNDKVMEVETDALMQAVDRVSIISSEKTRGIRFALDKQKLTLSARSPESGTATEEVVVAYEHNDFEIGFNSRYVLEMLSQLEGDQVRFVLADSNAPALVLDAVDSKALYVIMPMRV